MYLLEVICRIICDSIEMAVADSHKVVLSLEFRMLGQNGQCCAAVLCLRVAYFLVFLVVELWVLPSRVDDGPLKIFVIFLNTRMRVSTLIRTLSA
mmetsp:Transcript_23606/g.35850  ORF Transcript_23606/g.35850 Transcript_23606/m.35850 type:complete len:95 (-) Transcript_23606:295-579(-)